MTPTIQPGFLNFADRQIQTDRHPAYSLHLFVLIRCSSLALCRLILCWYYFRYKSPKEKFKQTQPRDVLVTHIPYPIWFRTATANLIQSTRRNLGSWVYGPCCITGAVPLRLFLWFCSPLLKVCIKHCIIFWGGSNC